MMSDDEYDFPVSDESADQVRESSSRIKDLRSRMRSRGERLSRRSNRTDSDEENNDMVDIQSNPSSLVGDGFIDDVGAPGSGIKDGNEDESVIEKQSAGWGIQPYQQYAVGQVMKKQ